MALNDAARSITTRVISDVGKPSTTAGARVGRSRSRVCVEARLGEVASPYSACERWIVAELEGARLEQVSNPRSQPVSSYGTRSLRALPEAAPSVGTGTGLTAELTSKAHCTPKAR